MAQLNLGDFLSVLDANEEQVSGNVEKFLQHTVILVDKQSNRFLVEKKKLVQLGFVCPTYQQINARR